MSVKLITRQRTNSTLLSFQLFGYDLYMLDSTPFGGKPCLYQAIIFTLEKITKIVSSKIYDNFSVHFKWFNVQ